MTSSKGSGKAAPAAKKARSKPQPPQTKPAPHKRAAAKPTQDQKIKKGKAADQQATKIIDETVDKIKTKRAASDADLALGQQVKDLRDKGMAWWAIGRDLNLRGAGDTVASGKGGAASARRLYKLAFGDVPRTHGERKPGRKEGNSDVRALRQVTKRDRIETIRSGGTIVRDDMTDEEVLAMVSGRKIQWLVNLANLDGKEDSFFEQEAHVHEKDVTLQEGKDGARVLRFREMDPTAPIQYRALAGAFRCVRLDRIHGVR